VEAVDRGRLEPDSNADYVQEQDPARDDASFITVIIGVATSLILIVIGSFKRKIEL
jgi:hypothetical protein